MKLTNYSDIAKHVEASLDSLRIHEMNRGADNADAAFYTVGVLKALLCESLQSVPAKTQEHILRVLDGLSK